MLLFHEVLMLLFCACLNSLLTDSCQTGSEAFRRRYRIDVDSECGKTYALTVLSSSLSKKRSPSDIVLGVNVLTKFLISCRFVTKLSVHLFNGDTSQAAFRILSDYRKGKFGWVALERPPT